jgi:muramoyltetrapeptide carboxypeptidase
MRSTVNEIIANAVSEYKYPVCFGFPAGHVDYNLPLILGSELSLSVNANVSSLFFKIKG